MRGIGAIAVVFALLGAPLALYAGAWESALAPGYCTMDHCYRRCPTMQHAKCQGSGPAMRCDCMRYPAAPLLAPLGPMILPHPAPRAKLGRVAPSLPALPRAVLAGFLPAPFHPPRG